MTLPFAQLSFPELYERVLVGPLFRPWVEALLDDAQLSAGERVLDIACGTGIVARGAAGRLAGRGAVVGVDMSAPMLAVARELAPDIDWREGDAAALPLRLSESFDVVLCQQGLQFFPDRPAAVQQMRRALAPKGRVAVSTWLADEGFPVLRELRRVAERHVGAIADRRHSFGEASAVESLLREAGFHDIRSSTGWRTIRFDDGGQFVRLNATALVGMSVAARNMSEEERGRTVAAIAEESAEVVRRHSDDDGFSYRIAANISLALD